ncbi:MAG TPA: hypothetical protein PL029_08130 [Bacteroidia bacterium]|nr:hypothetical protein [Bacteroidia bacterium]
MIIISDKPGQFANLLFVYANFLAYGFENKVKIKDPAFHAYRFYFKSTSGFSVSGNKPVYKLCYYLARILVRLHVKSGPIKALAIDWHEQIDPENAPQLKKGICFVQGWRFRSDRLLAIHQIKIRDFFNPAGSFSQKVNSFFAQNFTPGKETIIGLHIRRGDYKTFEGGKYYYSIEQYVVILKNLALLFKNEQVHFLISSNETTGLNAADFSGFKITFAPGHELLDLYCLSKCSYIAGPPSTYSMWASFYGQVPLCMISDPAKTPEKSDFKIHLS